MEGSDDTSHPPLQEPSTGPPTTYAEPLQPASAMTVPMNEDATSASLAVKVEQDVGGNRQHSTPLILSPHTTPTEAGGGQENLTQGIKRDHDSMDSQESSRKIKHDPMSEKLPKTATNHPSFRLAEEIANSIPRDILSIIEESGYTDADFEYFKKEADRVRKVYTAGEMIIGLKGRSGTGKSSLINCLLGYDGIAPSGSHGDACTAVVQEFRRPRPSQKAPFEAEITFLQAQARDMALKTWVSDFWDTHKFGADEDQEDDAINDDCDEEVQNGEASATAVDAIHSLFLDHMECSSIDATKMFLSSATSRGDPRLLAKLRSWTDTLLKKLNVESGTAIIRAPMPDDLRDTVAPFLARVPKQPSPWPLVKLVKCYFDSPILSQDIVLADLPGTSDINKTRTQATKMYMEEVHHIGVVDRIERVVSDSDTNRSLIEAYKRKRGAHVFLAVTHTDPTTSNVVDLIDKSIDMPGASSGDVKELCILKTELDTIKSELQNLITQQKQALTNKDYALFEKLSDQGKDLEAQEATKHDQSIAMCVEIRNNKVRKTMVSRYYQMMKKEVLPVFCVSNSEYLVQIKDRKEGFRPRMSVDATGIPQLRAYIYALPSARKLVALKHHIKYVLPSLINNLGMTCSQSKLKRREELKKILLDAQDPVTNDISQVLQDTLDNDILAKIKKINTSPKAASKTRAAYISVAKEKLNEYATWNSGTQKVFCRHKGQWRTPKVGARDWNAELMESLVKDIQDDIRPWDDISDVLGRSLSEKITGTFQSLISKLEDSSGPSRDALEPFFAELRLQVDIVDGLCKSEAEELERSLVQIKQCTTSSEDTQTCYFVQALHKTYDECVVMKGAGVRKKRMAKLEKKLSQKGAANPFQKVHDQAKSAAQELIGRHTKSFTEKILGIFGKLHGMFMRSFGTDENDTPEARALRSQLRSRLPDFQSKITECERLIQESESEAKQNL